jgi:hypothetical protein
MKSQTSNSNFRVSESGVSLELGIWNLELLEGGKNSGEPVIWLNPSVFNSVIMFLGGLAGLP